MPNESEKLAWRVHPEPNGTDFSVEDLLNKEMVVQIFDFCQILEATIFAKGWKLLFDKYEMKGLININKKSGWFDVNDDIEAEAMLLYEARISGYDPEQDVFGVYNQETGNFGKVEKIP